MAELAFSVAEKVFQMLGSPAYKEISLAWNVKRDLKMLQDTMSTIQAVLLDAEKKQEQNRLLSVWLGRLKAVFHDAVDVLDEFECEDLRRQVVKLHGSTSEKVCRFFTSSNPLVFHYIMGHRVKEIRERLDVVAKDRHRFQLEEQLEDKHIEHKETLSFVHDSNVIGRDDDKKKIIDLLMQPCDNGNVSVISIVGIGGLGKTTLAQLVYNDEMVKINFNLRVWVCVSVNFKFKEVAKEILESLNVDIDKMGTMEKLQIGLLNILKDKNFLLFLDGVWNVEIEEWDLFKGLLKAGAKESKIVVTTRSHKIASDMAPTVGQMSQIYKLTDLPNHHCWSLFLRCAFKEGEEKQHPELVKMGEEIVKKCRGVPLAVRTLGCLLYDNKDHHYWISIRDSEMWKLDQKNTHIMPALRLSYNQLPLYLKQCFAYCSLYPKNYKYNSVRLIQSWMASGLLQKPNKSTQELEDIGEQYIQELSSRSFFQEVHPHGFFLTFKIHDLIHDLSLYVAQKDFCSIENFNDTNNFENVRHVSILDCNSDVDKVTTFLKMLSTNMRTIIFSFHNWKHKFVINKFLVKTCISRFKQVRLLDLSYSKLEALPSSISTLKHLRYLNLEGSMFLKNLPNSICDLQNLETLLLARCEELEELPRDIRKMISLKFFVITTKQMCLPTNGIECMCSLRNLAFVGCPRLKSLPKGIQRLTSLRRLAFKDCESLISLPQGMKDLTALECLYIRNCKNLDFKVEDDYPRSLRVLRIISLPQLVALPEWLLGSANTLQFLSIYSCENLEKLPEWLPKFSLLRELVIRWCPKLLYLPKGMDGLTSLKEPEITGCPKLSVQFTGKKLEIIA